MTNTHEVQNMTTGSNSEMDSNGVVRRRNISNRQVQAEPIVSSETVSLQSNNTDDVLTSNEGNRKSNNDGVLLDTKNETVALCGNNRKEINRKEYYGQQYNTSSYTWQGCAVLAALVVVSTKFYFHPIPALTQRILSTLSMPSLTAEKHSQCRIYLAPSSVKGLNGFGMFTTEDLKKGDSLLNAPDGPSIPIIDYRHSPLTKEGNREDKTSIAYHRRRWIDVWDNYWWGFGVPDPVLQESNKVIDYQIMFGSLPNHHCALHSIDLKWPKKTDLPEYAFNISNPGIGAFSKYRGRDFFVDRDVKAGDELFLDYGHCDGDKDSPDWADYIPKTDDFVTASRVVKRLHRYIRQHEASKRSTSITEKMYSKLLRKAKHNIRGQITDQVVKLLPSTYNMYNKIIDYIPEDAWDASNYDTKDIERALAKYIGTNVRDVQWIRSNGMCLENLIPKPSIIPDAGRGAFAQFTISTNELIVPASMLQIHNKEVLTIYDYDRDEKLGSQLLENYCFGHSESTLLLCPNTNAILINHCSVRTDDCGLGGPNAMYRWATSWDTATEEWMNMSIDEMLKHDGRGISMEIIATRDIKPGDEVFIDYGESWEKAWEEHKANWLKSKPTSITKGNKNLFPVDQLNSIDGPLTELVSGNIREVTEDSNIRTMCVYEVGNDDTKSRYKTYNKDWKQWDDETILDKYASDGEKYSLDFAVHTEKTYWPCSVLLPEDELGEYYTVRIHQAEFDEMTVWGKSGAPRLLTGYPRTSIRYFYYPYRSEIHLAGVFRRHIDIRDEIFPKKWKNRKP